MKVNNSIVLIFLFIVIAGGGLFSFIGYADYQQYIDYQDDAQSKLSVFCKLYTTMSDYRCTEWANEVINATMSGMTNRMHELRREAAISQMLFQRDEY